MGVITPLRFVKLFANVKYFHCVPLCVPIKQILYCSLNFVMLLFLSNDFVGVVLWEFPLRCQFLWLHCTLCSNLQCEKIALVYSRCVVQWQVGGWVALWRVVSVSLYFPQAQKVAEPGPLCPGWVLHLLCTCVFAQGEEVITFWFRIIRVQNRT